MPDQYPIILLPYQFHLHECNILCINENDRDINAQFEIYLIDIISKLQSIIQDLFQTHFC